MNTTSRWQRMIQRALFEGLLVSLPIWALGCIIPTPLEGEPASNQSPLILGGTPDFTAGPVVSQAEDDVVLAVQAMDPDADETLFAGLYYRLEREGEPPEAWELARARLAPTPGDPGEIGTAVLTAHEACERLAAQPEHDKLLHVYVTDRPLALATGFNPFLHTHPEDPWTQHSAHAQWVLNCR
jgi:hypothetical protein